MSSDVRAAGVALARFSGLTGAVYPLVVTGVAGIAFPAESRGSLIATGTRTLGSATRGSAIRGSALVGQQFSKPGYGWGRPSAIAMSATGTVAVDLITASGSGLDPHLSVAGALFQVHCVARARGLDSATVSAAARGAPRS